MRDLDMRVAAASTNTNRTMDAINIRNRQASAHVTCVRCTSAGNHGWPWPCQNSCVHMHTCLFFMPNPKPSTLNTVAPRTLQANFNAVLKSGAAASKAAAAGEGKSGVDVFSRRATRPNIYWKTGNTKEGEDNGEAGKVGTAGNGGAGVGAGAGGCEARHSSRVGVFCSRHTTVCHGCAPHIWVVYTYLVVCTFFWLCGRRLACCCILCVMPWHAWSLYCNATPLPAAITPCITYIQSHAPRVTIWTLNPPLYMPTVLPHGLRLFLRHGSRLCFAAWVTHALQGAKGAAVAAAPLRGTLAHMDPSELVKVLDVDIDVTPLIEFSVEKPVGGGGCACFP